MSEITRALFYSGLYIASLVTLMIAVGLVAVAFQFLFPGVH